MIEITSFERCCNFYRNNFKFCAVKKKKKYFSIPSYILTCHVTPKNVAFYYFVPSSKPLGGSTVDSVFHPSEVDKMSTRDFWELNGKK